MTNSCQPRCPTLAVIWLVVDCQYTSDVVPIQVEPESRIDLLGYSGAAEARVALFHFYYRFESLPRCIGYDFFGWTFRPRLPATAR